MLRIAFLLIALAGLFACRSGPGPSSDLRPRTAAPRGWGIDAVLSGHLDGSARPAYLALLQDSGIGYLRERGPHAAWDSIRQAGFRVVGFIGLQGLHTEQAENRLPEDLLAVYHAAVKMGEEHPDLTAWEMVGEPDVGYARDLPDRVAAFQKAVYLGIKAAGQKNRGDLPPSDSLRQASVPRPQSSAGESGAGPLVLMGALALPPGPWLERAARNGLLDYTDAYNFHFYGEARDLTGVIEAHRAFMQRGARERADSMLPIWITEAGINAVDPDEVQNPERRRLQADFTVSTARQALAAPDVAMFMPFILVWKGDGHAMTLPVAGEPPGQEAGIRPWPAWEAYAQFTRDHPWPNRRLARPPTVPNPVVVQWLPDAGVSLAHKVSGTYRFREGAPIRGEIRLYNLGPAAVRGRISAPALAHMTVAGLAVGQDGHLSGSELELPALSRVSVPVTISPATAGYFREDWEPVFVETSGRRSSAFFAFERWPEASDFVEEALVVGPIDSAKLQFPLLEPYRPGESAGVWTTVNGLRAQAREGNASAARFWTDARENDPLQQPLAVARVANLPREGFIRLQLGRPMDANANVRVDLVDGDGQRFSIFENLGTSYFVRSREVWLNLRDFHMYIWSRATSDPTFRPERIREIQLRFVFTQPGAAEAIDVSLSVMRPR